MANITLFVPDDLKKKMEEHEEIRWSAAVRTIITQKLDDFAEAERLAQKSRLTASEASAFASRVDKAMGEHAEALLDEGRCRR